VDLTELFVHWEAGRSQVQIGESQFDEEIACRSSAGAADARALFTDRPADLLSIPRASDRRRSAPRQRSRRRPHPTTGSAPKSRSTVTAFRVRTTCPPGNPSIRSPSRRVGTSDEAPLVR